MPVRVAIGIFALSVLVSSCSGSSGVDEAPSTPEGAVVSWIEAVDAGDTESASAAIHPESLAIILGIENGISSDAMAEYLTSGVPMTLQKSYWDSFSDGFTEFAEKPLSSLAVGEAEEFVSEGETFASVPVTSGPVSKSVVIVRQRSDQTWEVDMVASLGDGFSKLLLDRYEQLGSDESAGRIRLAYAEVVEPSLWAAIADGSFGDAFTRTALTLIDRIDEDNA
jgi:hypothetical protein